MRILPVKLLFLVLLAACVTVNVYFPAAAAEQAADRIIDTVTSERPSSPTDAPRATPSDSGADPGIESGPGAADPDTGRSGTTQPPDARNGESVRGGTPAIFGYASSTIGRTSAAGLLSVRLGHAAVAFLDILVPRADAAVASPNLEVSSPQIKAVTASMQRRFAQMQPYFDSGAIGLTVDGEVAVRDPNALPLAQRALVTRLVSEDNRDRNTLYGEIARTNGHPEWEPDIRRTFARRWVERGAKPGWFYQDTGGRWVQK